MAGYVTELRKQIGTKPMISAYAGAILVNHRRQILLQLRADNHCWGIPGGSMELGESFEETARREVFEETGLILGKLRQLCDLVLEQPREVWEVMNGSLRGV
ncbi:NUDIX domain-containing protein [Alicyclobacillus fodiniaquatilis]|uniref:NUDIX domain-containing protein n=1 Tax=Alicyclobacillus fodiniaquatilis TaxID=1661150 RepID=A0ABW4JQ77_9BACL